MKVIVNRKQYDKLIKEGRGYSKNVEKWADYVTDEVLLPITKQDVEEDVYLLTKLSLKLNGKDFIASLVLGYDVAARISQAARTKKSYPHSFHPSTIYLCILSNIVFSLPF